jgi:lipopolysaccharide transport system permease protein
MMKREAQHTIDLFRVLLEKELRVRYKSTALGFLWSLANPIAFALVFYLAFKFFMRFPMENYLIFLLVALFPWQWFSNTLSCSANIYLTNASLIKKVIFPRSLLPITTASNHLIHFLIALLVSIPLLAFYGYYPRPSWILGIPLLILIQAGTTVGLSMLIAVLNVFFRDLEHMVTILVQLLFWMTPIIYPASLIPEKYRVFFWLNPMYPVIPAWRTLVLDGWIDWKYFGISAGISATMFALGYFTHRKLEWRLAESV